MIRRAQQVRLRAYAPTRLRAYAPTRLRASPPPHLRASVPLQVGLSAGPGCKVESVKVTELFAFDAMGKTSVEEASAGDIVTFAGIENFNIGDTVVDLSEPRPLEPITVEQPTMSMTFGVNKSAVAGKVGKKLTMRVIKDRLEKARVRVRRVSLGSGSPIHPEAAGPRPKVGT